MWADVISDSLGESTWKAEGTAQHHANEELHFQISLRWTLVQRHCQRKPVQDASWRSFLPGFCSGTTPPYRRTYLWRRSSMCRTSKWRQSDPRERLCYRTEDVEIGPVDLVHGPARAKNCVLVPRCPVRDPRTFPLATFRCSWVLSMAVADWDNFTSLTLLSPPMPRIKEPMSISGALSRTRASRLSKPNMRLHQACCTTMDGRTFGTTPHLLETDSCSPKSWVVRYALVSQCCSNWLTSVCFLSPNSENLRLRFERHLHTGLCWLASCDTVRIPSNSVNKLFRTQGLTGVVTHHPEPKGHPRIPNAGEVRTAKGPRCGCESGAGFSQSGVGRGAEEERREELELLTLSAISPATNKRSSTVRKRKRQSPRAWAKRVWLHVVFHRSRCHCRRVPSLQSHAAIQWRFSRTPSLVFFFFEKMIKELYCTVCTCPLGREFFQFQEFKEFKIGLNSLR